MSTSVRLIPLLAMLALTACHSNNRQGATTTTTTTTTTVTTQPQGVKSTDTLELVYQDNTYQFTGIAKKDGSPLYVSYPRWSNTFRYSVVQVTGLNTCVPYPSVAMNNWTPGISGKGVWVCVQALYFDDSGNLWVVDPAAPYMKNIQGDGAKLVEINTATGQEVKKYTFMKLLTDTAYVNDVRVDTRRQYAYLTNSREGAIIAVDLKTGRMRQVLYGHYSTVADPSYRFSIDSTQLFRNDQPLHVASDGIALTPDGNYLYYKPLSDDKLYRIKTDYLRDWNLDETSLEDHVEELGHFVATDGMIFDKQGNLYMGDIEHKRIVRIDSTNKMTTLVQDPRLLWPDSYAIADGYLYVSCSQIENGPDFNNGTSKRNTPYCVYRVKL
jgi:sugar lactone lactonase YvrE